MSKKVGKKAKVKVPEIDPNSPEWMEEVARKQNEAYDIVQRAMTRSQVRVCGARFSLSSHLWPERNGDVRQWIANPATTGCWFGTFLNLLKQPGWRSP